MKTTSLTTDQKDKLTAAIKQALNGTLSINAALYPRPKVEPADAFNVLDPNKNNAVDNTYIVIDNIPATYLVSFYWNDDYSIVPVASVGTQIRVKVPSALVIAAGETLPQPILVIYSVLNPNEPDGVASEPLQLTVRKYVRPAYPKPVITEAQGTELDVTALTANAHMTLAAWTGQAVGQKLWLSVVSTPQITLQNWNPLNVTTLGAQSRGISKDLLKTLNDGSTFTLKLEASFDGGATRFPFSEQAYTIRSGPAVIPAPVIVEALAGTLNPITVVGGATFRASYPGMRATDTIVPVWNDISDTIPSKPGEPGGSPPETVESPVPAALIGKAIGKTIDVRYQVHRGGQEHWSDVLKLTIEAIPPTSLPTPVISQASGSSLDVGALQGDADLTVQPWPFIAVGQKMSMHLEGSNNLDLPAWQEYEITSTGTQSTKIPLSYLEGLADASTLRLVLKVSFDGGSMRQEFPVQSYTVIAKPVPEPLTIDQTTMSLNGLYVAAIRAWPLTGTDAIGNTEVRKATGGTPPYSYSSSNPRFVSVNNQGKAKGRGWGSSTITVTDAQNNKASYTATASNMYAHMVAFDYLFTYAEAVKYTQDNNCLPIKQVHVNVLARLYGTPFPSDGYAYGDCWCSTTEGCGSNGLIWQFPSTNFACHAPSEKHYWRGIKRLESLDDVP